MGNKTIILPGADLKAILKGYGVRSKILTGDTPTNSRQDIVAQLNKGQIKILIATGQLIGEVCVARYSAPVDVPVRLST